MFKKILLIFVVTTLSSCFSYTTVVGKGAQGKGSSTGWNHYAIFGAVTIKQVDDKKMAGGAKDYTVTTRNSFLNMVIFGLTAGIYTPSTTTVQK